MNDAADGPIAADTDAADLADAAPDPPVHLPVPVDLRGAGIGLLATLAGAWALHWASAVFIPLLLGLLLSYSLAPAVQWLARWHVPRALGAALLLGGMLSLLGGMAYSLSDDAAALVETLPDAAQKLRESLRSARGAPESAIDKVQRAAARIEEVSEEHGLSAVPAQRGVTRVQIERGRFNVKDYLWSGTLGLLDFAGQATVVCFIAFFLLAAGDHFRRKMARIAGPSFARRRITVEVLDDIDAQIQRYLLVQILGSVLVGVVTALVFYAIGLQHAMVWGVAAAVLNLMPYLGSLVLGSAAALVAFLQFGTPGMALWVAGASLAIHTLSGNLLVPWLTSRASRMNPVAVFVGVLAWGWLWGIWGLLLGAPLLMVTKAVCDRIDPLMPLGELLGE